MPTTENSSFSPGCARSLQSLSTSPIILGNAPSSGSSLLRILLGRHPAICGGGELSVFDKRDLFQESDRSFRKNVRKWLQHGYPADWLGPDTDLFNHLQEYPWSRQELAKACANAGSYGELLQQFFQRMLEVKGRRRWIEKTPSNVFCFDCIQQLFPDAKFIHIVRDGRDCVASYYRRCEDPFRAVSRWYYATLTGIQYRCWPNYCELRYEDLVENPERELRRLCAFLGEEYTDAMLAAERPESGGLGVWRSHPRAPVNQKSVGQYQTDLPPLGRALFQRVRLSRYGKKQLPFGGAPTGVLSPLELQQHLGYGTDGLVEPIDLDPVLLRQAGTKFKSYRWKMLRRYWKWLRCATEIA